MKREKNKVYEVSINELYPNPDNIRDKEKEYNKNYILMIELMESIKEHGVLQPLLVDMSGKILAGNRRYYASKHLNKKTIPCLFIDKQDKPNEVFIQIEENMKRSIPDAIERGKAYQELKDSLGWNTKDIENKVGGDVRECLRSWTQFQKAKKTAGKDKMEQIIENAKSQYKKGYSTIAKVIFKRIAIHEEDKVLLVELATKMCARVDQIENVAQRLNNTTDFQGKEKIEAMIKEAMKTETHQILVSTKIWRELNRRYTQLPQDTKKPATLRHYFKEFIDRAFEAGIK